MSANKRQTNTLRKSTSKLMHKATLSSEKLHPIERKTSAKKKLVNSSSVDLTIPVKRDLKPIFAMQESIDAIKEEVSEAILNPI